jgi:hypothetical protein
MAVADLSSAEITASEEEEEGSCGKDDNSKDDVSEEEREEGAADCLSLTDDVSDMMGVSL